jgi:MFS family permease
VRQSTYAATPLRTKTKPTSRASLKGLIELTVAFTTDLYRLVITQLKTVSAPAWSPLRLPLFRALWIASVASNIGTWMHEIAAGWLITSLTASPVMAALMQTATSFPTFLLALPAGALADVVNRRRMLLFTQGWMLIAATILGVLTLFELTTPWVLLIATFFLGAGAAMNAPAWQATMPELVARKELPQAVALTGMGLNLARAAGPALGGAMVATAGPGAVFVLNAISFVSVILVLYRWRRPLQASAAPAEQVMSAIRAGIRYARHAPALRAVLVRTGLFVVFASALWALLPVLARHEMELNSMQYGILFGCLGAGAVAGAILLPILRSRVSTDSLVVGATVPFAAAVMTLSAVRHFGLLCVIMIGAGLAWITVMASLNVAMQTAVPSWVRARALALYLLVFQGGMAAGGVLWGSVTEHGGIALAFLFAGVGLIVGLAAIVHYRLNGNEQLDLTPSPHWPEPTVTIKPRPQDGPVLVTVEYRIDSSRAHDFIEALEAVRQQRLRDGAFRASLYRDPADPNRYLETFVVESWAEHLRQRERVTVSDRIAEDRALALHLGDAPPVISHYIYAHSNQASD